LSPKETLGTFRDYGVNPSLPKGMKSVLTHFGNPIGSALTFASDV